MMPSKVLFNEGFIRYQGEGGREEKKKEREKEKIPCIPETQPEAPGSDQWKGSPNFRQSLSLKKNRGKKKKGMV